MDSQNTGVVFLQRHLSGEALKRHTGLTQRRFHWWVKKGYIEQTKVDGMVFPRYTRLEACLISIIKELIDNTRIAAQHIPTIRTHLTEVLFDAQVIQCLDNMILLILFHSKKPSVTTGNWYDVMIFGKPFRMAMIRGLEHRLYYTIDVGLHWPKENL